MDTIHALLNIGLIKCKSQCNNEKNSNFKIQKWGFKSLFTQIIIVFFHIV